MRNAKRFVAGPPRMACLWAFCVALVASGGVMADQPLPGPNPKPPYPCKAPARATREAGRRADASAPSPGQARRNERTS
jgi:hypothetical protein